MNISAKVTAILSLILLISCSELDYTEQSVQQEGWVTSLGYQSRFIHLNSYRFRVIEAGGGDTIILLHGFPYFAEAWHPLIKPLSKKFYLVAPDNRGYGRTAKPEHIKDYKLEKLTSDVVQLINHVSPDRPVTLIGHDWGGVLTWSVAQHHPELLDKVVVINAPPMPAFLLSLATYKSQQKASAYIGKLSGLPAKLIFWFKGTDLLWGKRFEQLLNDGYISTEFKQAFYDNWQSNESVYAAIKWYQANIPEPELIVADQHKANADSRIDVPSLLIWSSGDKAFTQDTFNLIESYVSQLTIKVIDSDSHAPFLDHQAEVLAAIEEFLAGDN